MKKTKPVAVWDKKYEAGVYDACLSCARKHKLDLGGTAIGIVFCEFCGAEYHNILKINDKGIWELHSYEEGDEIHLTSIDSHMNISLYEDVQFPT